MERRDQQLFRDILIATGEASSAEQGDDILLLLTAKSRKFDWNTLGQ